VQSASNVRAFIHTHTHTHRFTFGAWAVARSISRRTRWYGADILAQNFACAFAGVSLSISTVTSSPRGGGGAHCSARATHACLCACRLTARPPLCIALTGANRRALAVLRAAFGPQGEILRVIRVIRAIRAIRYGHGPRLLFLSFPLPLITLCLTLCRDLWRLR
jgi:hypothetical protein